MKSRKTLFFSLYYGSSKALNTLSDSEASINVSPQQLRRSTKFNTKSGASKSTTAKLSAATFSSTSSKQKKSSDHPLQKIRQQFKAKFTSGRGKPAKNSNSNSGVGGNYATDKLSDAPSRSLPNYATNLSEVGISSPSSLLTLKRKPSLLLQHKSVNNLSGISFLIIFLKRQKCASINLL